MICPSWTKGLNSNIWYHRNNPIFRLLPPPSVEKPLQRRPGALVFLLVNKKSIAAFTLFPGVIPSHGGIAGEKKAVTSLCTPRLFVCFEMASRWELSAFKCDLFTRRDEITWAPLRPNARLNFYFTILQPSSTGCLDESLLQRVCVCVCARGVEEQGKRKLEPSHVCFDLAASWRSQLFRKEVIWKMCMKVQQKCVRWNPLNQSVIYIE